ncbi:hypothetical protein AB0J71_32730 [Nonomuraea sp. NPDC049637]|uniref:hypothetical protein n=1 Tax=Nonomuraea sp. NPDC049637 TaxID=3154356 RepID=UPI003423E84B
MRKASSVLAVLVLASVCVLASDTALSVYGRTADDADESASRWTVRYTTQSGLRLVPTADGGALLFAAEGRRRAWSMLRWDGVSWKRAGLPKQLGKASQLEVGGSPSGETIWAVATVQHVDDNTEDLWRWSHGSWTRQRSLSAMWNPVIDIAVDSRDNAWFVTSMDPDGGDSTVLYHSGKAWRQSTLPVRSLAAVAATGPDDVWAVSDAQMSNEVAVTLHWNGTDWKKVDHPCMVESARSSCRGRRYLQQMSLAAQPDGHAWAVGPAWADGGSPIVLHWDRTQWKQVSLNLVQTALTAVRTDPASGLWIAANPASGAPYVINLRDGRWTKSTLPGGSPADRIIDIAPTPGTTRLWVQTERHELADNQRGDKKTSSIYELVQ